MKMEDEDKTSHIWKVPSLFMLTKMHQAECLRCYSAIIIHLLHKSLYKVTRGGLEMSHIISKTLLCQKSSILAAELGMINLYRS